MTRTKQDAVSDNVKARQQPAEQEPENVDRDSESEKGEEKGTVDSMYDQCVTFSNLKEVRVIHRLAKGSVSPGHQWPVGGAPVLSLGLTPPLVNSCCREKEPDDDKALLFRNLIIVSTLVWTPVQARVEQENRAMGTETETGTQIPSTITTGRIQ